MNIDDLSNIDEEYLKKVTEISDAKLRAIKSFTFFDYLRSLIIKRRKGNHYFISIFRKHLLSEEHFLKSHIKIVFLEKQHNFHGEENTNILECFNEL